jgi:hypothetical protein
MGGKKQHKRGSIPSSLSSSSSSSSTTTAGISTEMIERTPENDYGVLSDPEENSPSTPVPLLTKENSDDDATTSPKASSGVDGGGSSNHTHSELSEQSQPSHSQQLTQQPEQSSSQQQHPSSQQPSPLLQSQKSQTQAPSKSLGALQLKLSRDKNFSQKITLHTFFSYVILAIEMQRAGSASIARISPHEVEILIIYMIEHHSATEDVKSYLRTLIETKVIRNLIEAIIEFNKDQTDALDKLLITEENELKTNIAKNNDNTYTDTDTSAKDISVTIVSSDTIIPSNTNDTPQTPHQRTSFFQRMRCFFSGCCGCK